MILLPDPWWPGMLLALALFTDAVLSLRAPRFIRECLDGVGFPRDWWTLIVIKLLGPAGLLIGLATLVVSYLAW